MSLEHLDDDDWEPAPGDHPTWSMEEIDNHPLFMETLSGETTNTHIEALQAVLYDEETPYGLCHNFRNQGNDAFKRGFLNDSVRFYQSAISSGCEEPKLLSLVHANLALVYLKITKLPEAVDECFRAIGLDSSNVKAYYRGALASFKLDLFSQALYFAKGGIDVDSTNKDLLDLLEEIDRAKKAQQIAKENEALNMAALTVKPKYRWRS